MKHLKKVLAVIVTVCLLATFAIPAFAEEAKSDVEICVALGIVKGTGSGVTPEYLAQDMVRYQGAIMLLRLLGKEDEAKAYTGTDNFDDANKVNATNQAILAYLKAHPEYGFVGIGNNKFDPLGKFTAKAYYKVLLTTLGYEEGVDFTWSNVLQFAASKGLYKLVEKNVITNEDLCVATVEALKATVKGSELTLIEKLVEDGVIAADVAEASGIGYSRTAKPLEIVSATADNLITAKFVFNKELNADTVTTGNFGNSKIKDVKLLDDKKTVLVILSSKVNQSDSLDFTVENLKATDGTTISKVTKSVTFIDTTVPVITGVVAKNAKTLIVTANEPLDAYSQYMSVFGSVKVDGNAVVASTAIDYVKNTITFNLASLLSVGTHKVEISGLKDFAGYVAVTKTFDIEVAEDKTAPEIIAAKVNNPKEIEVTFSEDIDPLYKGEFTVNGYAAYIKSQDEADRSKITIGFDKALDIGATVEIKIGYKNQQDVVGNKVSETKYFVFKVEDDTTIPTVTVSVNSGNELVFKFSKPMLKEGTLKLYDVADNNKYLGQADFASATWESNNTVAKIKPTELQNINAKDIKLNITGMKDATVRANELGEQNITVRVLDTEAPVVFSSYTVKPGSASDMSDDTITFYFSEAMDAETAKNLSNYKVITTGAVLGQIKPLSLYSNVSFKEMSADGKQVVLTIKGIRNATTEEFEVYALKDLAGNFIATTNVSKASTEAPTIVPGSVVAVEKNKVEITYTQDMGSVQPGAYVLRKGTSATSDIAAIVISTSVNGKKATLTLDRNLNTSTSGIYLHLVDKTLVKNPYGRETGNDNGSYWPIGDHIKPEVTFTATKSGIMIEFSELVKTTGQATLVINDLINEIQLTKGTSEAVNVTSGMITMIEAGKKYKIELEESVEYYIAMYPRTTIDMDGNFFVPKLPEAVTTKPN